VTDPQPPALLQKARSYASGKPPAPHRMNDNVASFTYGEAEELVGYVEGLKKKVAYLQQPTCAICDMPVAMDVNNAEHWCCVMPCDRHSRIASLEQALADTEAELEDAKKYCTVHNDSVHGAEAEQLRSRLEKLFDDANFTEAGLIQHILDDVDACDSLAFLERIKTLDTGETCPTYQRDVMCDKLNEYIDKTVAAERALSARDEEWLAAHSVFDFLPDDPNVKDPADVARWVKSLRDMRNELLGPILTKAIDEAVAARDLQWQRAWLSHYGEGIPDEQLGGPKTPEELRALVDAEEALDRDREAECDKALASVTAERDALKAKVEELTKLFTDAGQGEHNVLALIEHYQRGAIDAEDKLGRVRVLCETHGCDCECGHHQHEHDGECTRCFACLIGITVKP